MDLLRLWFGLHRPVTRGPYAASGFGLAVAKYAIDAIVAYGLTGGFWDPLTYLHPVLTLRMAPVQALSLGMIGLFGLWTVPFMWIGFSMTLRRAVDAGLSPWMALLFFLPVVNLVLFLVLCFRPSKPASDPLAPATVVLEPERLSGHALRMVIASLAGALCALSIALVWVNALRDYGYGVFLAGPLLMGLVAAFVYNRPEPRPFRETLAVLLLTLLLVAGALILFAFEGALCVLMALPIALVEGLLGILVGAALANRLRQARGVAAAFLVLPVLALADVGAPPPATRSVVTAIEIEATPEVVWERLLAFSDLAPPRELVFRLGIAYPTRARILGHGVGAERHCEFSTGAFVEPITAWEEPRRLAFDVRQQPPVLEELSPYRRIAAPHLENATFRSRRGEFRLEPLPEGRTRLVGTTWYTLDMAPGFYWGLWTDALVHRIHHRVLDHIRTLAENNGASVAAPRPG